MTEANYHPEKTDKLIKGFKYGFDLGYQGPTKRRDTAANIPITVGSATDMWNKIMKEVKLGRYAGPYTKIPYKYFVQSPVGLVPKDGNKTRLIFHLSYDFPKYKSVNFYTPDEICTVKYKDLDFAIRTCLQMKEKFVKGGQRFESLFYSKTDVVSAFRILPSSPKKHFLFILKATHPQTQITYYFVDKCMPFGSSISCALFQEFSDALAYIIEYKHNFMIVVMNYLDDFLFIAFTMAKCNELMRKFLEMCRMIGCQTSEDKTEWATDLITFLGMLLNGKACTISIPIDKVNKAINLLELTIQSKKVTVKHVQRLTGVLNFLSRAIVPGHTFTRCMYDKLKVRNKKGELLKQHHHVQVNKQFKLDALAWKYFLEHASSPQLCRPFVDFKDDTEAIILNFYTDASKTIGMGAIFNDHWMFAQWEPAFIQKCDPSIEFLELFALCAAILAWETQLHNVRIIIFNDNQAVLGMVNKMTSKCEQCMKLL